MWTLLSVHAVTWAQGLEALAFRFFFFFVCKAACSCEISLLQVPDAASYM